MQPVSRCNQVRRSDPLSSRNTTLTLPFALFTGEDALLSPQVIKCEQAISSLSMSQHVSTCLSMSQHQLLNDWRLLIIHFHERSCSQSCLNNSWMLFDLSEVPFGSDPLQLCGWPSLKNSAVAAHSLSRPLSVSLEMTKDRFLQKHPLRRRPT